jgi:hypothetical protein
LGRAITHLYDHGHAGGKTSLRIVIDVCQRQGV